MPSSDSICLSDRLPRSLSLHVCACVGVRVRV